MVPQISTRQRIERKGDPLFQPFIFVVLSYCSCGDSEVVDIHLYLRTTTHNHVDVYA